MLDLYFLFTITVRKSFQNYFFKGSSAKQSSRDQKYLQRMAKITGIIKWLNSPFNYLILQPLVEEHARYAFKYKIISIFLYKILVSAKILKTNNSSTLHLFARKKYVFFLPNMNIAGIWCDFSFIWRIAL